MKSEGRAAHMLARKQKALGEVTVKSFSILSLLAMSLLTFGCVSNGARPSIWPTTAGKSGIGDTFSSTAKGVKGQFSSMGTAVTSAYGKAKTSLTSAFSAQPAATDSSDPTSLTKPSSLKPEIFVAQGQLYESSGQHAKALDNYSKALEIEPKNLSALQSVARLHDRMNQPDKASEFYKKALDVNPGSADLHVELGNLQKKQGQIASAKESYQKAINLDPKSRTYRSAMANALIEEGRDADALQELSQSDAPAMANYQMAYLHFSRQNVPQAQTYLNSALQIDPNLQPARDLMAQLGGTQMLQQSKNVYQTASGVYQNVQGLMAQPTGYVTPAQAPALNTLQPQ